jgi:hypothetical protein
MPSQKQFLAQLRQALESIREQRFFQGELIAELRRRLKDAAFPGNPVVEQEYQKTIPSHGIRIRPDIIIHIPFERGLVERRDKGNFVAIELKRRATAKKAQEAFGNLTQLKATLQYPVTVFINIDSKQTFAAACPRSIASQTVCFAVRIEGGKPVVQVEECHHPVKEKPSAG